MLDELKSLAHEVIAIQTELVESQAALRLLQGQSDQHFKAMLLDIVEVMDLLNTETPPEQQAVLLKKVQKRLEKILRKHGVEEMNTEAEGVQVGKVRVIGTESQSGLAPGQIVSLVRRGYTWKGQCMRPADVITASGIN